jgi:prevent-host-death family protein
MKRIPAGKFKARCLSIMDDVQATGEPVIVTKRARPVAKIVRVASTKGGLFGFMAGEFKIVGDIESPVTPREDWGQKAAKRVI